MWNVSLLALAATLVGCAPQIATEFDLTSSGLSEFDVEAGVPVTRTGTGMIGATGITIGSGSIELDPSVITVTPAEGTGGKLAVQSQTGEMMLIVTVRVDAVDEVGTVCATGEAYGPFEVTLNANFIPTRISPSRVRFGERALDAFNTGDFSLCLEVTSPVTGVVTISSLTFNLGL